MNYIIKYSRLLVSGVAIVLFSVFGIVFSSIRPFHRENNYKLARWLYKFTYPIFRIKVEHVGLENFDKVEAPYIIVSNHQSNLDVFILGSMMPKYTVALGKKDILYLPFFGQLFWIAGNIVIDRYNRGKAMQAMRKVSEVMKKEGKVVWIMPEGTRSRTGELLPFKKGAFYTAIAGELPIVPVVFSNIFKDVDLGKYDSGTVKLRVLDPISTKGKTNDDVRELMDSTREKILKTYNELNS